MHVRKMPPPVLENHIIIFPGKAPVIMSNCLTMPEKKKRKCRKRHKKNLASRNIFPNKVLIKDSCLFNTL